LAASVGGVVVIACLGTWPAAWLAAGVCLFVAGAVGITRQWLVPRLLVILLPTIGLASFLALTTSGGWAVGLLMLGRALAISTLAFTLLGTTPLPDLVRAAVAFRVPSALVQIMLLAVRYLDLLADELARVRMALRVRGYRNRVGWHAYRTIGQVAGLVLVRGAERAERVSQAMRCRGYTGQYRTLHPPRRTSLDLAWAAAAMLGAVGLLSVDWWLRG
jgi:cobalt/nickel transport system permease protein